MKKRAVILNLKTMLQNVNKHHYLIRTKILKPKNIQILT